MTVCTWRRQAFALPPVCIKRHQALTPAPVRMERSSERVAEWDGEWVGCLHCSD